jgi:hypothetical protein
MTIIFDCGCELERKNGVFVLVEFCPKHDAVVFGEAVTV